MRFADRERLKTNDCDGVAVARASPRQRHVTPRGAGVPLARTTGYTRRRSDASARSTFYAHIRRHRTHVRADPAVLSAGVRKTDFGSGLRLIRRPKTKKKKTAYEYETTIKPPVVDGRRGSRATERVSEKSNDQSSAISPTRYQSPTRRQLLPLGQTPLRQGPRHRFSLYTTPAGENKSTRDDNKRKQ